MIPGDLVRLETVFKEPMPIYSTWGNKVGGGVGEVSIDKKGILYWCDSVEKQFNPRELDVIPRGEKPLLIEEQFLATSIRYLRAVCLEELKEKNQ